MPYYEIHAIEKDTNTVITTVIQTSVLPAKLQREVEKGGLQVLKINVLDQRQVAIYERMRLLSNKRNIAGFSMNKDVVQPQKGKILWMRVIAVAIVVASLALCLSMFL